MKDILLVFATVGSGLGLFLLGMKHLSDGLQAAAGGGLRKFMAHATSHPIVGVGTTATGWLAAIGGTADARRAALAHTLSNVFGSILLMPLALPVLVPLGKALFPNWSVVTETAHGPMMMGVMAPIAVSDTIFSVVRGVLTFSFVKPFVRLIEWMIPQPEDERPHLSAIKAGVRVSPVIACDQALLEVDFMKASDLEMLDCARKVIAGATGPRTPARRSASWASSTSSTPTSAFAPTTSTAPRPSPAASGSLSHSRSF